MSFKKCSSPNSSSRRSRPPGILIVTPLVLAITPMTALQDPLLGPVFAKLFEDGDVDDRLVVMLYLLVENLRGDSSFWAPYP